MNIVIDYPYWIYLVCVSIGVFYALFLYGRSAEPSHKLLKRGLFILRSIAVTLIVLLLFSPLWKQTRKEIEKPVIIVAQDNSSSMIFGSDSIFYKTEFLQKRNQFIETLRKDHEVITHTFGNRIQAGEETDYSEKSTDISSILSEMQHLYAFRNVGGLILISDGIYNRGYNPLNVAENLPYPIYTVAAGDTTHKKDWALGKISYPHMTFLNHDFPVQIVIHAHKLKNRSGVLSIEHGGQKIYHQTIAIDQEDFTLSLEAVLSAKVPGTQRFRVHLSALDGETTYINNSEDLFIDVLDDQRKILLIYAAPHPDIAALKQSLEEKEGYEIITQRAKDCIHTETLHDLVILHQLPSAHYEMKNLLQHCKDQKTPLLWMLGKNTLLEHFNTFQTGLSITGFRQATDEVTPVHNESFALFSLSEKTLNWIKNAPPLIVPFGDYKVSDNAQILCHQRVGKTKTARPLIMFSQYDNQRFGVIAGTELWKWRLADFAENNTHSHFNEIINKSIQFLAKKEDKSRFRIIHKPIFDEAENVSIEAEVYNETYEPIQNPEVKITIKDSVGNSFPYGFEHSANAYKLNLGFLSPGTYTYHASTRWGGKTLSKDGMFVVSGSNMELSDLVADHNLLYSLAHKTGGMMIYPSEWDKLTQALQNNADDKPVSYEITRLEDFLNLPWMWILLIILLGTEWFLRKYNGLI